MLIKPNYKSVIKVCTSRGRLINVKYSAAHVFGIKCSFDKTGFSESLDLTGSNRHQSFKKIPLTECYLALN